MIMSDSSASGGRRMVNLDSREMGDAFKPTLQLWHVYVWRISPG